MNKNWGIFLVLSFLWQSCAHHDATQKESKINVDYLLAATLWVQTSAEYRALSYQAFNVAKEQLQKKLSVKKNKRPLAVVLDVDETVLDNSEYQASNILLNRNYNSENWKVWTDLARAKAIPGALDFLNFASKKGVEIFYVTNRKDSELDSTYKNLKAVNFPVKKENIYVRGKSSGKEDRRILVAARYQIALLVGDNMADFSSLYEKKNVTDRALVSDQLQAEFGTNMIVLPNPMYGDWEASLYNNDFSKSEDEKSQIRKAALRPMPL